MPYWMKCWIGLTRRKNSKKKKKKKNHIGWRKIVSDENLIASKFLSNFFRLIQQNFHFGLVYSLFYPTFHSSDVISNVRTSNFEWFNKTKTLCKMITIKKSHTSTQVLHTHPKHFLKCVSILYNKFLYYVLERTQLMSLLYAHSPFTSGWLFIIRYKLHSIFLQHLSNISLDMLDKMLDRFN